MSVWRLHEIQNYDVLSLSERETLSRGLNGFTIFCLNEREEYDKLSEEEKLTFVMQRLGVEDENIDLPFHLHEEEEFLLDLTNEGEKRTAFAVFRHRWHKQRRTIKLAWKVRAVALNHRILPGALDWLPRGSRLDKETANVLLTTLRQSWRLLTKDFVQNLKKLTIVRSGVNGRVKLAKNTQSSVRMPMDVNVGSHRFRKLTIPHCLSLSLFGEIGTEDFRFKENEIVRETKTNLYLHVMSHDRASELFQLDDQIITKFTCVRKRVEHLVCGKAFMKEVGTDRVTVGHVLHEKEDNSIEVFCPALAETISFARPCWNEANEGGHAFDEEISNGHRLCSVEPMLMKLNIEANSLWTLCHKVAFGVDDNQLQSRHAS